MKKRRDMRNLLWSWGNTAAFCKNKQKELREYEALYDDLIANTKRLDMAGDRRAIGGHSDPVVKIIFGHERTLREYAEAVEAINQSIFEALQRKKRIYTWISYLSPIQQKILIYRYTLHMKWDQIEAKMSRYKYSSDYLKQLEARAIDGLLQIIPETFF